MSACIATKSTTRLLPMIYTGQFLAVDAHDPGKSSMSCRKRLLSEQSDYPNATTKYPMESSEFPKRTKTGVVDHESKNKCRHHGMQSPPAGFFESIRVCRSAPGVLRRQSLTHASFTYIKNVSAPQTNTSFLPALSKTTASLEKNMLAFQQKPVLDINQQVDNDSESVFLTCAELAACMTTRQALVIDCGSPLRHTERRIHHSLLLNVSDKISRKRLATRGLKNFLDNTQLSRLDSNEFIVLYDDYLRTSTACANSSMPLSPSMKCVFDEIKRHDANKTVLILQSTFDEFHQHYPSLCYISTSTDEDLSSSLSSSSLLIVKQLDIDTCVMSEILPGLYLGSSRDAEDLSSLQQNNIHTIINISTSIPCYFENEKHFEYLRLPCHDSPNQNIVQYFESTFEYIHGKVLAKKNVLIHCQGGVSRSPSFIIGYLMKYHSKTFDEAHQLVKHRRSIINPNFNFLGQLTQYQHMC